MKCRYSAPATIATLLVVWTFVQPVTAASAADLEKQFVAKIDELMPGMGAAKIEDRKDAQMTFEHLCFENSTPAKQIERKALCKALMQRVGSDVALPARVWLLRKVETIGREEVVPGLAQLMGDKEEIIRETARRALANNPVPAAAAALRAELDKAQNPVWKLALVKALGWRRDVAAVPQIVKLTADGNAEVAHASVAALGTIADSASLTALAQLRKQTPKGLENAVNDASFRAAQTIATAGKKWQAADIFEEYNKAAAPEALRITALQGIAAAKGAYAVPELLMIVAEPCPRMRLVAACCLQRIPGSDVTRKLTAALAGLNAEQKAVMIEMLGRRGDASARAEVAKYLQDKDADVQVAAIGAMRYIGNGSVVQALVEIAGKDTGAARDAARDSLKWMTGKDVDAEVLKLAQQSGRIKAEAVRAAAVRLMKPAMDAMLSCTHDSDESVRVPVIYNVGKLAKPADLPKVMRAFAKLEGDQTRSTAKDALVRICSRIPEESKRGKLLIDGLASAEPSTKVLLIQAVASVRGEGALEALRKCAQSEDSQIKQAAVSALADWGPVYCSTWAYSGPYKKDGAKHTDLFDVAFAPEEPNGKAEWKQVKDKGYDVDLKKLDKGDNICGYLRTQIVSDKQQDVILCIGSDDGVKVWVDGVVVDSKNMSRGHKRGEDEVKVTLKKGVSTLLLKVTQGNGDWFASCGIKSPQGGPADGVSFEAK